MHYMYINYCTYPSPLLYINYCTYPSPLLYINYCTYPSPLLDTSTKSMYMQSYNGSACFVSFFILSTTAMLLMGCHKLMQHRVLFCCLEQLILKLTLPMWPLQGPWIPQMWMMWSWIALCTCTLDTALTWISIVPGPADGPAEVQSNLIAIGMVRTPFYHVVLLCALYTVHWLLCKVYLVCVAGAYAACGLHCG